MKQSITKPDTEEYSEFYKSYIAEVSSGDVIDALKKVMEETDYLLLQVNDENADYFYAPGKWTIKELVSHLIDSERIFAYRATRFARNDSTALPGFEEDEYVINTDLSGRSLDSLREELLLVRKANLFLFNSFKTKELSRGGISNNNFVTVKALVFITAGHAKHHLKILKERYL